MKKKLIFSIIMIMLIIPSTIFAFADELIENPKPEAPEEISEMASVILGTIQWAGYAIAVGMLLYIAIKYMMSAANEKASLKQTLINWVIGAVIVCGVTTIFTGVVGFFRDDIEIEGEGTGDGGTTVACNWTLIDDPVVSMDQPSGKKVWYCSNHRHYKDYGKPNLPPLPKDDATDDDDTLCQHLNVVGSEEDGYTCKDCNKPIEDSSKPIVNEDESGDGNIDAPTEDGAETEVESETETGNEEESEDEELIGGSAQ